MFLLAYNGTSFKRKTFLSIVFLAAHCFMSSPQGKVRMVNAKKMRKRSFKRFDHVHRRYKIPK